MRRGNPGCGDSFSGRRPTTGQQAELAASTPIGRSLKSDSLTCMDVAESVDSNADYDGKSRLTETNLPPPLKIPKAQQCDSQD